MKTKSARTAEDWRSVLRTLESNWHLKNQKYYGSWQGIKWKVCAYALSGFITLEIVNYLDAFRIHRPVTLQILYYCCYLWYWIFYYVMPLLVLHYILRKITILDDAIGLRKEVQAIVWILTVNSVLQLMASVVSPSFQFIDGNEDRIHKITSIMWPIIDCVWRILYFFINYKQTLRVIHKLAYFLRRRSKEVISDPTAISLSTSKRIRRKAHETTLRLIDVANASLTPDSEEKRMEMKITLMKYPTFEAFMRFLLEVCFNMN